MRCLICRRAETMDGLTSISFQRDEFNYLVRDVPARLCPDCGDAYVSEEVAAQVLHYAQVLSEEGIVESIIEYNRII